MFHDFKFDTDTPYFEPIPVKVSPDFTVYDVSPVFDDPVFPVLGVVEELSFDSGVVVDPPEDFVSYCVKLYAFIIAFNLDA